MWAKILMKEKPVLVVRVFYILLIIWIPLKGVSQECLDNLQEAKRAYFNGNFDQVLIIENCYKTLDSEYKNEALELIINAHLVLDNNQAADQYMNELLSEFPLYQSRSTDLIEFQELYKTYEIRTKWNLGAFAGINIPDFHIMQYRSIASITEEPSAYDNEIGISMGLKGEWFFYEDFFLSGSLLYQQHRYNQTELIMSFQEVSISERMNFLSLPVQVGYEFFKSDLKVFVSAGISPQLLVSSKGNINLLGTEPDFPTPLIGVPQTIEGYNLSDQRRSLVLNYVAGAGIRKSFGLYAIELSVFYEYGLNNLVDEENRYADENLFRTYSYVPDDFKMDHIRVTFGVIRSFVYSSKKK